MHTVVLRGNSISEGRDHHDLKGNVKNKQADYDYLANLAHLPPPTGQSITALEDTQYYLQQANLARSQQHWAAVEVFYQLAWQSLPPAQKQAALIRLSRSSVAESMEKAKNAKSKDNQGKKPTKNGESSLAPAQF